MTKASGVSESRESRSLGSLGVLGVSESQTVNCTIAQLLPAASCFSPDTCREGWIEIKKRLPACSRVKLSLTRTHVWQLDGAKEVAVTIASVKLLGRAANFTISVASMIGLHFLYPMYEVKVINHKTEKCTCDDGNVSCVIELRGHGHGHGDGKNWKNYKNTLKRCLLL